MTLESGNSVMLKQLELKWAGVIFMYGSGPSFKAKNETAS